MQKKGKETPKKTVKIQAKKDTAHQVKKGTKEKKKGKDFRTIFLESLLFKKGELEGLLDRLMSSQKEYDSQLTSGDFIDELDDAQREISTQNLYSLIERKTRELKKIEFLINRIREDGEFGICEECDKPIPKERLLIMPGATLCVPCQRELEKSDHIRNLAAKSTSSLGGKKGVGWEDSENLDDEGYVVKITPVDSFSLADIQETDPDDAFIEKE
ncbi:MAG: TraR/DksA family transcriptional regulator [Pseudomonadota bacterium]